MIHRNTAKMLDSRTTEVMESTPSAYRYERAIGEDELRILTINPSNHFESRISCELKILPRKQCEDYTALSYCWDPQDEEKVDITIGRSGFGVGNNLAGALQYLRGKEKPCKLWVDAICIDQQNLYEKSVQVQKMENTYRDSTSVIVWLGAPSGNEKILSAISIIDNLGSQLEDKKLIDVPSANLDLRSSICDLHPKDYAISILSLLKHRWFTRLWVIQEICLAPRDAFIMCGDQTVSFWKLASLQIHPKMQKLFEMAQMYMPEDGHERHKIFAESKEPPIGLTRQYFVAGRKGVAEPDKTRCTLLSHLWNFRQRNCSHPEDRVYALLAIAKDQLKASLKTDYTNSASKAFTLATRAIIETHNQLYVMGMCHVLVEDRNAGEGLGPNEGEETVRETGRPSWVPDFNLDATLRPPGSLTQYTGNQKDHDFAATGASQANATFSRNCLELTVRGYFVDTIEDFANDNETVVDPQKPLEIYKRARRLALLQAGKPGANCGDVEDAFWRTLITNRNQHNKEASPDTEGKGYEIWWKYYFEKYSSQDPRIVEFFVNYQSALNQHFHYRNFFTTRDGYLGLCPLATQVGDEIHLLSGSQVPFVLRKHGGKYQVIGECYVHGIMDGSLWQELESKKIHRKFGVRLF